MKLISVFLLLSFSLLTQAQVLSGRIMEAEDSTNINYRTQIIVQGNELNDTIYSDEDGAYKINLAIGTYQLIVDKVGYEKYSQSIDIKGNLDYDIYLKRGEVLDEVEVVFLSEGYKSSGTIALSRRDFNLLPASFDDPTRLLIKYQAISTTNDQANSIVYRGLPSHYLTWSLNDALIVNPNHTSNAGTLSDLGSSSSGGTNMIGGQMIDQADFKSVGNNYTFNALSGINNLKTTTINKYFQASFLGVEGGYQFGDVSLGYRYSFTGLLGDLGVDFGGEEIRFQDFNLRFHPTLKKGNLIATLILGNSSNEFGKFDEPQLLKEYQDISYKANNIISTFQYTLGKFSIVTGYSRRVDERTASGDVFDVEDLIIMDEFESKHDRYFSKVDYNLTKVLNLGINLIGDHFDTYNLYRDDIADKVINVWGLSPSLNWNFTVRESKIFGSLNPTYRFTYEEFSPDFKVGYSYQLNKEQGVGIDVQHHSMSQPSFVHLYTPKDELLRSTKAININLRYFNDININSQFEFQAFYHYLYDVPITPQGLSAFNTIDLPPRMSDRFESHDDARIAGISAQYEVNKNEWWLNINASYFKSQYRKGDTWLSSTQDFGQTYNSTLGKIWSFDNNDKFLRIGLSFHYRGGAPIYSLLPNSRLTDYEYSSGVDSNLDNYWRVDGRISYVNKNNVWSLDIQNMTNRENDAFIYRELPNFEATKQYQLGLIPVLSYRKMF